MSSSSDFRAQAAEALLESACDAIILADAQGVIRLWNPGAERIFGYTPEEALGHSLDIIIPERLRERHWSGYKEVMRTHRTRYGSGDTLAVPAQRKDGEAISIEFTVAMCRDERGEIGAIVATIRDVTARFNEMRALRQAARRD